MSQQANFSQQAPASFAPIHSHLDSIITRQMHGLTIFIQLESPFKSPSLPICPHRLLRHRRRQAQGLTVGMLSQWQLRQLRMTAVLRRQLPKCTAHKQHSGAI